MKAALLLTLSVGLLATPANAQRHTEMETGSHIFTPSPADVPSGAMSDYDRKRIVMAEFARCTIDRFPTKAEAALRMPIGPRYWAALTRLASSDCLGSGILEVPPLVMRGALFAELWRRRAIAEAGGKPWRPVFGPFDPASVPADGNDEAKQHAALMTFAGCVVDHDKAAASDVVTTQIGSTAQNAAYVRLQPRLGPCLSKGISLKFSKSMLEGVLAETLYRSPANGAVEPAPSPVAGNN